MTLIYSNIINLAAEKRGLNLARSKENTKYHKDRKTRTTKKRVETTRLTQDKKNRK
jgi:hypothetical protein